MDALREYNEKKKNWIKLCTQDRIMYAFITVIMVLVMIIIVYPLIFVISSSFSSGAAVTNGKGILLPVDFSVSSVSITAAKFTSRRATFILSIRDFILRKINTISRHTPPVIVPIFIGIYRVIIHGEKNTQNLWDLEKTYYLPTMVRILLIRGSLSMLEMRSRKEKDGALLATQSGSIYSTHVPSTVAQEKESHMLSI